MTATNSNRERNDIMFSSLSLSAATLSVQFVEEMLFLHPTPIANATTQDTLVFGTVTVWVPKSRRLKALEVKLEGKQDLGWMTTQRPYESSITLERTVSLVKEEGSAAEGLSLEKGEHTFVSLFLLSAIRIDATGPSHRSEHDAYVRR